MVILNTPIRSISLISHRGIKKIHFTQKKSKLKKKKILTKKIFLFCLKSFLNVFFTILSKKKKKSIFLSWGNLPSDSGFVQHVHFVKNFIIEKAKKIQKS